MNTKPYCSVVKDLIFYLVMAGGFEEFASKDRMALVRNVGEDRSKHPISFEKVLADPDQEFNMIVLRGDALVIP